MRNLYDCAFFYIDMSFSYKIFPSSSVSLNIRYYKLLIVIFFKIYRRYRRIEIPIFVITFNN